MTTSEEKAFPAVGLAIDDDVELQVKEILNYLDRFILLAEKELSVDKLLSLNTFQDAHWSSADGQAAARLIASLQTTIFDNKLPSDRLLTALKIFQYYLHESKYLEGEQKLRLAGETRKSIAENKISGRITVYNPENKTSSGSGHVTFRRTGPDLLNRSVKENKMGQEIKIPTMPEKLSSATTGTLCLATKTKAKSLVPHVPRFNYEHFGGNGCSRNLPLQPEMIRLLDGLDDPERNVNDPLRTGTVNNNYSKDRNPLLSVFGGNVSPPLVQKQTRKLRENIVCEFCKLSAGNHHNWCINFKPKYKEEIVDIDNFLVKRSEKDNEIHTTESVTEEADSEHILFPELTSSNTNMETMFPQAQRSTSPDYRSLHRDVYLRALADARARLVLTRARDFVTQTTKPWVFSYFPDSTRSFSVKRNYGMSHIFGKKHTDFTEYYKRFVNEYKQKEKQEKQ